MSDYLDINNEELLKDFFSEAEQQVETLESNILVIENDPSNREAVDEIFRAAHTLKGGSATVEMTELSGFTHVVEDLLDEVRSDKVSITEEVVDVLLTSIDVIKAMLQARADGSMYEEDVAPLKAKLESFLPGKGGAPVAPQAAPIAPPVSAPPPPVQASAPADSSSEVPTPALTEADIEEMTQLSSGKKVWSVFVRFDGSNPMRSVGGIQVFTALKECGTMLRTIPEFDALFGDDFYQDVFYFVASSETGDTLEDVAFIDDVAVVVDARPLDSIKTTSAAAVSAEDLLSSPEFVSASSSAHVAVSNAVPASTPAAVIEEESLSPVAQAIADEKAASPAPAKKTSAPAASSNAGGSVLRVESKRIDYLLNLVSETVITKASFNQTSSQIGELQKQFQTIESSHNEKLRELMDRLPIYLETLQNGGKIKDVRAQLNNDFGDLFASFDTFETDFKNVVGKFRSSTQNLGRIAGDLQEGVMKIRMVPISQIFSRFPRVVRDLSRDLDKKINLVIEGEDTELDKSVIEDLLDPIMHCVRNSLDHGIEQPLDRLKVGKGEEGTLNLVARNEGNMIVIDIIDDGKGIDVNKVRNKAIERGVIHPNKLLSDHEAYQLIFEPGFSTADKITNVSGRGVGLDVVKTQIEKLNGTVVVTSEPDVGSKFSIRLPLTLAIIQGLLVRVGSEVYSIPVASVIENHRIKQDEINTIDNYEVFTVRDEVISILRLDRLFGIKKAEKDEYSFVVIVGTAEKKLGIIVDSLIGEEDVVIKPLRDQFTSSPGIAGASILGDGSVSLIIDVSQLLELGVKQELAARQKRDAVLM